MRGMDTKKEIKKMDRENTHVAKRNAETHSHACIRVHVNMCTRTGGRMYQVTSPVSSHTLYISWDQAEKTDALRTAQVGKRAANIPCVLRYLLPYEFGRSFNIQ